MEPFFPHTSRAHIATYMPAAVFTEIEPNVTTRVYR